MITLSKSVNAGLIVGSVVVVVVATAVLFMITKFQPSISLFIGDGIFDARIAKTIASREKGLGGVSSIDEKYALILAFPTDDTWQIWMKDMKVPIDIIWLDKDKKIIDIVKDASPEDSINVVYTPKSPARYVVEVSAGTVDRDTIRIGRTAIFEINPQEIE